MAGEMVRLPVRNIIGVQGAVLKTVKLNEDGEVVYKKTCAVCGRPEADKPEYEMTDLTTLDAIRQVCLNLAGKLAKPDDAQYIQSATSRVLDARGREHIRLPKVTYDWLHRALARKVPLSKEETEENASIAEYNKTAAADDKVDPLMARTMAEVLWQYNAHTIKLQLTPGGIPAVVDEEERVEA